MPVGGGRGVRRGQRLAQPREAVQLVVHRDGEDAAVGPEADDAPARGVGGLGPHFVSDGAVERVAHGAIELRLYWIELHGQAHGVVFPNVGYLVSEREEGVEWVFGEVGYLLYFFLPKMHRAEREAMKARLKKRTTAQPRWESMVIGEQGVENGKYEYASARAVKRILVLPIACNAVA